MTSIFATNLIRGARPAALARRMYGCRSSCSPWESISVPSRQFAKAARWGIAPVGAGSWRRGGSNDPVIDVVRDFERLTNDMFRFPSSLSRDIWAPRVEVTETEKQYQISVELPGVKQEDVKVELNDNVLTVSGKKESSKESDEAKVHTSERFYGSFSRSWTMPDGTTDSDISAAFNNGVLEVTITKKQNSPPPPKSKTIDIKSN